MGLTEEQLEHLGDDPLPDGVYEPAEAAIVRYAQASARMKPITDEIFGDLAAHFNPSEMVQINFVVGLAGLINRFHSTFLTTVDPVTQEAVSAVSCPVTLPQQPAAAG